MEGAAPGGEVDLLNGGGGLEGLGVPGVGMRRHRVLGFRTRAHGEQVLTGRTGQPDVSTHFSHTCPTHTVTTEMHPGPEP